MISPAQRRSLILLASLLAAVVVLGSRSAGALAAGPAWTIDSVATPTNFSSAGNELCEEELVCDEYLVTATNVGTSASTGTVLVRDSLPEGIEAIGHRGVRHYEPPESEFGEVLTCTPPSPTPEFTCESPEPVHPGGVIEVLVRVRTSASTVGEVLNHVEVEEVGSPEGAVSSSTPFTVPNTANGAEPGFGIQDFGVGVSDGSGSASTIAGARPTAVSVGINLDTKPSFAEQGGGEAVQEPRSVVVDLPLGFVGDPLAATQCPESTLTGKGQPRECPRTSAVGVVALQNHNSNQDFTIYNMQPEAGYPATFAFEIAETTVLMPARVIPTDEGYMLSVAVSAIPRSKLVKITGFHLTFWGDPGAQNGSGTQTALFTNPLDCNAAPLKARLEMDSWVDPSHWVTTETPVYESSPGQAVSGCEGLQFAPSLEAEADGAVDSPAALNMRLSLPQTADVEGVQATSYLRDLEVALPEGMSLSPGAANGLVACLATGPEGIELGNQDLLGPDAQAGEEIGEDGVPHATPGHCPAASEVGTIEATTPILSTPLTGHLFLAEPECGGSHGAPCNEADVEGGRAFRVYAELAGSGVVIKLPGTTDANRSTGRLTIHFDEDPQFPFTTLSVYVNGGSNAPLSTPQSCGSDPVEATLTPWSAPFSGAPATAFSSFSVGGCPASQGFAPAVLAQSQTTSAGAHTSFAFSVERQDGEADLTGVTTTLPPGLLGAISDAQLCSNAAAAAAACPAGSLLGPVEAAIGSGPAPYRPSGNAYLTEGYGGAPFGLAIVIPTTAGPFTFAGTTGGGDEVVRATISVDPLTTAITIHTEPLPQMIDGVQIRLRLARITVNRPGFMVNPTNCAEKAVAATIEGEGGAREVTARPFAATGCRALAFAPTLTASSAATTSKKDGASLRVKVTSPSGEANIATVKVTLPKQLPTRDSTLKLACPVQVYDLSAAHCPAASLIGTATAVTPLLKSPLTGPAYFVSHASEAFPDVVVVLKGEGITVELVGHTDIKNGVTTTTYNAVPDAPISSFELVLPRGPYSILGAYLPAKAHHSLCGQKLAMPVRITGQNGAVIERAETVGVSGCRKVKKHKQAKPKATKKHARKSAEQR